MKDKNKIKEYKIIDAANSPFLEEDVNKAIKDGWQPLGGGFVDLDSKLGYHQVVVKYET